MREEERERNGEIKQKIITSHGCSGILLVLLPPGLLSGGGLRVVLLVVPPLHSSSLGILSVVTDVPTIWAHMGVSICFLSHNLHSRNFCPVC